MASNKTAGRKTLAPAEQAGPEYIGKTPADEAQQIEALRTHQLELVEKFGDGLPWQPEHYEAAIRSELRRGCEAFLRAGRYLLVARECALHGEWQGMLDRLGMGRDQASRMMEAARRVSAIPNVATSQHLIESVKTESKLIELLSLPEDQFKELAEVGETGDLALDDIVSMSVRELRQQIRELRADVDAKDQRISKLSDDLNKEHEKVSKANRRWKAADPDQQLIILKQSVTEAEQAALSVLGSDKTGLRAAFRALAAHASDNDQDNDAAIYLSDVIGRLLTAVRMVRDDEELPISIPLVNDGAEG